MATRPLVDFEDAFEGIYELNRSEGGVVHAVSSTYWSYLNYQGDLIERLGWAFFCDPKAIWERVPGTGGVRTATVTCLRCVAALMEWEGLCRDPNT